MRRGFTLVEMCIGMAITAMIASAVAAFSLGVSQNWRMEQRDQLLSLKADVIAARLRNTLQNACLLGACEAGSVGSSSTQAALLIWNADTNGDGYIQGTETSMIYYDPAAHQLRLFSGLATETTAWSYANAFIPSTSIDAYRTGRPSTLLADNIYGLSISTTPSSDSAPPSVAFAFQLSINPSGEPTESMVYYGRATLRAPMPMPSN